MKREHPPQHARREARHSPALLWGLFFVVMFVLGYLSTVALLWVVDW